MHTLTKFFALFISMGKMGYFTNASPLHYTASLPQILLNCQIHVAKLEKLTGK